MDVIVGAADGMGWAVESAAGGGEVFKKFGFDFSVDPRVAMFGGEDDMEQDVG